jgi:ribosome-associated heat shock protein Hsp15
MTAGGPAPVAAMRLDKWLWQARFVKSRALAIRLCESGRLRLDGEVVAKAHRLVRIGDVLTFPLAGHIRTVKVRGFGARRGAPTEAKGLYEDLAPPQADTALPRPLPAAWAGTRRPA